MFGNKQSQGMMRGPELALQCSFCNKSQNNVRKLIAGPSVFIWDECVEVCNYIIADEARFTVAQAKEGAEPSQLAEGPICVPAPPPAMSGLTVRCALCRMPVPIDDGTLIANRGVLCPGCLGEIEAAVAERRQLGS